MRTRILEAAYACVAGSGLARTTVEDVARQAGVSRATVYRQFPGGRDQLLSEMIAHETASFFVALADAVSGAGTLAEVVEVAILHAHRTVREHRVLQVLLDHEPERLLPALVGETRTLLPEVAAFIERQLCPADLPPEVGAEEAAEYVARMVLSHIGSPGRWDLGDRRQVAELVRTEILAGIVVGDAAPSHDVSRC